jgi:hypothetical protein
VYEDKTGLSPRRAWTVAWLGGVVIGVGNGVLRQAAYADRLGERAAHNVSGLTGVTAFAAYFAWLQRRWPLLAVRAGLDRGRPRGDAPPAVVTGRAAPYSSRSTGRGAAW